MAETTIKTPAVTHKKLSRIDLLSMAVGQIIGVGIMTMTGIAIGFTGRSVNLAYLVAGVITIFSAVPQIFIGGTANFLGGQYSQIGVLGGKTLAGAYTYINLAMSFAISMYTISFTEYFLSIIPGVDARLIAFVVLTVLFALHVVGVKQAAKLQNIMCIVLALAIAAYIVFGVGSVQPGYFSGSDFMSGGPVGFLMASIYLTFAAGGATYVVNYSSEAENPTKDIPFVIILSTAAVVLLYAVMSTIAAGVLPVSEVANKPLSIAAQTFMSPAVYTFFVVGGAMFALLTTLNFSIGMMTFPAMRACRDGWLPKKLGETNKRFGTCHWILLCFYLIGTIPCLLGMDLSVVANSTVILTTCIRGVIAFVAIRLPKVLPELWGKSHFHVSDAALKIISWVTIVFAVISVLMLIVTSSPTQIIGNLAILGIAVVAALGLNKRVKLEVGYTEK